MKPDVLLATRLPGPVETALDAAYTTHRLQQAEDKSAFLAALAPKIRVMATMGKADAALMDALPNLKLISSFGVGYDGVDVGHASKRGVTLTNTPDVLNDDVSNLAVLLVLAVTRNFTFNERYLRAGRWPREGDPPLSHAIRDRTVGIIGLGRIGKVLATKLRVFGCRIVYHGRSEQTGLPYQYYPSLVDMARDADVVIAMCPGGEATRGIVNAEVLEALGPEGIIVNVARGSVVDEDALVAALKAGKVGGAGLDVFAHEPNVPETLIGMDNVVLQPHQGSATQETRRAMWDLVVDNIAAFFAEKPLLTPVN